MSHYTTQKTSFKDREELIKALAAVGYSVVEYHPNGTYLYGYQGDKRADVAHVVVRRKHVGSASNDVGFRLALDGTYEAVVSEYDTRSTFTTEKMRELRVAYAHGVAVKGLRRMGCVSVQEYSQEGNKTMLVGVMNVA